MLADALARSDLRYLFVQGGVVLHGERNSMSPGFEFSLGDANLALIVASLFSLDARFLDHAAPLLVVRFNLVDGLCWRPDLAVATGGADFGEPGLVAASRPGTAAGALGGTPAAGRRFSHPPPPTAPLPGELSGRGPSW